MKDPSDLINKYIKNSRKAAEKLSTADISVTSKDITNALVEVLELNLSTDPVYKDLSEAKIISLLSSFDFFKFIPEIICEIHLNNPMLPHNINSLLLEQNIKNKGEIWTIHKNDQDPFPSNPHAHNYPMNLVAHLGTGELYQGRRLMKQKLKTKDLVNLRKLIVERVKGICLPERE